MLVRALSGLPVRWLGSKVRPPKSLSLETPVCTSYAICPNCNGGSYYAVS